MNITRTLLSGLIGTTTMTLYSYASGKKMRKRFEEPVLLHKFIQRGTQPGSRKRNKWIKRLDGWLVHYATGFCYSILYDRIWNETKLAPSIPDGMVLGAISGLAGISVWDIIFRMHPNPPEVDRRDFYKHLMAAHILFGMFAALGYRVPEENKNSG